MLLGLILFLPLFEAPKNLFWAAFVVTWLMNRFRAGHWGGRWDGWDSLIALWIASGYIVAAFAGMHHSEWGGANDILRYGSVLWLVRRGGYGKRALLWMLVAILVSTLIALGWGLWDLFVVHVQKDLELNSVGHVNHSAIYLAISYSVMLSALLAYWGRLPLHWRVLGFVLTLLFAGAVLITLSRGAVGAILLFTLLVGVAWARRSLYFVLALSVLSCAAVGFAYVSKVEIVQKQEKYIETNNFLSFRDQIWNTALLAWRQFPLTGVGMDNFNQVSGEKVQKWVEASGKTYVASEYKSTSHAHSLYLNTLVERGAFGLTVLLAVLSGWLYGLLRYLPGRSSENLAWALWGGSFGAWLVTAGVGMVNTTLHHEHGILSVLLLGMWLAYLRLERGQGQSPSV